VIVSDHSQRLLLVNRLLPPLSIVPDRPHAGRPFPGRNKQKKKYKARRRAALLAAAPVSSPQFPANILRGNARSTQSTLKNPTMKGKTRRVDVEFA
jgi:hypothetical protein